MGRSTRSDTAANFGKNDDKLKEFAKGEDVGHGPDHDCPACRSNRQALKLAGLTAKDIKGLEGGKPPVGDESGQPPQATTAFVSPAPAQDIRDMAQGGKEVTGTLDASTSSDPNDRPIDPAVITEAEAQAGPLSPSEKRDDDEYIRGLNEQRLREQPAATANPATAFTPEDIKRTDAEDRRALASSQRHRKLAALTARLNDLLIKTMEPRGYDRGILDDYEVDLGDVIVEHGGRYMLMAGFIPDDRDWHCEIGIGSERSHVKHPHKVVAVRLAMLLALDPRAGAALNSAFIQLLLEERPQPPAAGIWSGVGVQP